MQDQNLGGIHRVDRNHRVPNPSTCYSATPTLATIGEQDADGDDLKLHQSGRTGHGGKAAESSQPSCRRVPHDAAPEGGEGAAAVTGEQSRGARAAGTRSWTDRTSVEGPTIVLSSPPPALSLCDPVVVRGSMSDIAAAVAMGRPCCGLHQQARQGRGLAGAGADAAWAASPARSHSTVESTSTCWRASSPVPGPRPTRLTVRSDTR
jgi:hypothetical protein